MKAAEILSNPNWIPISLTSQKTVLFQEFQPGGITNSVFLDNRARGKTDATARLKINDIVSYARMQKETSVLRQLFHISHVGSTLIANVLQSVPESIVYREPTIFRALAQTIDAIRSNSSEYQAKEYPTLYSSILKLFCRGSEKFKAIKQTSGNLILPPESQIDSVLSHDAYLYTNAKDFLSHAINSQGLLSDAVSSGPVRMTYYNRLCSANQLSFATLKPLEKVALVWMTEMQKILARTSTNFHNKAINFDEEIRNGGIGNITSKLVNIFGISEFEKELLESKSWCENSKSKEAFSLEERIKTIDKNYLSNKIEIQKAIEFIRTQSSENINFYPLQQFLGDNA